MYCGYGVVDKDRLDFLVNYIQSHVSHLDRYMRPMFDPKNKRILVLGCGWGTETYWSLFSSTKKYVYGIDPAPRDCAPIRTAVENLSADLLDRFEHHQKFIWDIPQDVEPFDAIISNNVFEHVFEISRNLSECRRLIPGRGRQLHLFTDPLFYSSAGAHLPIAPWEHLTERQSALRSRPETAASWSVYRDTLNGMTITSFLEAVREAGMWVESLSIRPDRNRSKFSSLRDDLPPVH